jgi:hypothetical protein
LHEIAKRFEGKWKNYYSQESIKISVQSAISQLIKTML